MIFKKITLVNLGPYKNLNTINFPTKKDANTILIGGKNGAGKTTFLSAVRLALYGPLTYGYRTETREYFKKVSSLFNNAAIKNGENHFRVRIDFSIVENFKRFECSIYRDWSIENEKIKEEVYVIRDGKHLNEADKDRFFTSLRNNFPPSLLELCLFDGEEISKIISNDKMSEYLRELSSKIFNLDLFTNLENDLKIYSSQSIDNKQTKELFEEESQISDQLRDVNERISTLSTKKEKLSTNLLDLQSEIENTQKNFSLHGGIVYEEREKLYNEISRIEAARKNLNDDIKNFIAKELPFFMSISLLRNSVKQLDLEEDFHISQVLSKKIKSLPISELLFESNIQSNKKNNENLLNLLQEKLTTNDDVNLIHYASNAEAQQVRSLNSSINEERFVSVNQKIQDQKKLLIEVQNIKKQLQDNNETSEFNEMLTSISSMTTTSKEIQFEIDHLSKEIDMANSEQADLEKKHEKISKKLHGVKKKNSSFEHSEKIISVSEQFRRIQLRGKLQDVEYFSTRMLKRLFRKKDFINTIKIDPTDFTITILNTEDVPVNKDNLSAGEKELLILSIIWGVFTSSKRELPFIFDTLLGRLDNEHKRSVCTSLIPKFGKQVIVLSTDSEIDAKLHGEMHPYISEEYTLDYDVTNKRTNIKKGFFEG
ncbi:DNA sulfur modification protein DndD [Jeotgalibacillus marinus]|uniref:Nuclease SbcCD subunit C n=1 Tax=Jeotgalibacillus marinus TaxID=86667 RepID=A0ABV3Q717_9BACL